MLAILVTVVIACSAYGYGSWILRRLGTLPSGQLERSVFAILLGAGVLTFLILGIGLVGALTTILGWIVVAVGVLLAALMLRGLRLNTVTGSLRKTIGQVRKQNLLSLGCWVFLLLSASLNLLAALAPVSGTDVLAYHLAIPKLYVEEGRIRY